MSKTTSRNKYLGAEHLYKVGCVLLSAVLSSCGGGDSVEAVQLTHFSEPTQSALAGDWPNEGNYYVVLDETEWRSIWADRRRSLNCDVSINKPACDMVNAPIIDFSNYVLVGLYLGSVGFIDRGSNGVTASRKGSEVIISFFFLSPNLATANASNSAFYLINRNFATISFVPMLNNMP
jgi:hypothetical protein